MEETSEKTASENAANVIWRGKKEPPAEVRLGMLAIALPAADEQRAGFYSEHARRLVINVPGFKFLKPKG